METLFQWEVSFMLYRTYQWAYDIEVMFFDENVVGSFMVFSVRPLPKALVGALIVPI